MCNTLLWFCFSGPFAAGRWILRRVILSFQSCDPVSDVVLQTFPRAVPQCFCLSFKTLDAVVLLGHFVLLNEAHHVFFYSMNLSIPPYVFGCTFGAWQNKKKRELTLILRRGNVWSFCCRNRTKLNSDNYWGNRLKSTCLVAGFLPQILSESHPLLLHLHHHSVLPYLLIQSMSNLILEQFAHIFLFTNVLIY